MVISAGVGVYAWRRRAVTGAALFALFALLQALMTLAFGLELVGSTLRSKLFWDNVQFVGRLLAPLAFLAFALEYCGYRLVRYRLLTGLLAITAVVFLALTFTDGIHGWVRRSPGLLQGEPFDVLTYEFGWLFWLMSAYAYGEMGAAIALLVGQLVRPGRLYRGQVLTVLLGILIPNAGMILAMAGVRFGLQRDTTPVTFAVGNLIIAWGLFRFRLFDIVPTARDAVIESMHDAVAVLDPQDRVVDINPALAAAVGRRGSELVGRSIDEVFAAWPDVIEWLRGEREEGDAELPVEGGDGGTYLNVRSYPLLDYRRRQRGRVIVVQDVTERRRVEQELRDRSSELQQANSRLQEANRRLEQLSQVKDEFVANVSHELQTPISNQKLCVYLLEHRPEKQDVYLTSMKRETERLEAMIEGLLSLSRLDQGRMEPKRTPVDLNELARTYWEDRRALAESKGLALEFETGAREACTEADAAMIGQVLGILLTNALTYTPPGGRVVIRTDRGGLDGREWVGFSVSDTGPGIPANEQPQVFSRFFRGSAGRSSSSSGTGLGLAIAREIVQRHDGRIELDSAGVPGEGATFRVWLPPS